MEGTEEGARKCIENTLSTLIRRNFVAETIDAKFEVAENVDAWLPELLENSTWRNLIYSLSEQNPQSQFLKVAIHNISDAGFQHEITNVNTAAQQFLVLIVITRRPFTKQELQEEGRGKVAMKCAHMSEAICQGARKDHFEDVNAIHFALVEVNNDVRQAMHAMINNKCLNPTDITCLYEVSNF
ncbi:unnamed protein product [Gongylonema pulchrum]|uniref:EKC/KEOPS complex subunit CGI121 n=1 Tax=Gongylonema pulchrum TaxID=637853 RepID=A0A183DQA5_9BILA|nr:unnamed protein product [Gongylonema pulchrum]